MRKPEAISNDAQKFASSDSRKLHEIALEVDFNNVANFKADEFKGEIGINPRTCKRKIKAKKEQASL